MSTNKKKRRKPAHSRLSRLLFHPHSPFFPVSFSLSHCSLIHLSFTVIWGWACISEQRGGGGMQKKKKSHIPKNISCNVSSVLTFNMLEQNRGAAGCRWQWSELNRHSGARWLILLVSSCHRCKAFVSHTPLHFHCRRLEWKEKLFGFIAAKWRRSLCAVTQIIVLSCGRTSAVQFDVFSCLGVNTIRWLIKYFLLFCHRV